MNLAKIRRELAPTGSLRVAINLANTLLVSGRSQSGVPEGLAPDLGAQIAARLGVPVELVPFEAPSAIAESADRGLWDVALIAAEPARAKRIFFTRAYSEIQASYLVRSELPFQQVSDVDQPATRIAAYRGSAYDLWLSRNIQFAEIVRADSLEASVRVFVEDGLEALAGLRASLTSQVTAIPGARLLPGCFSRVQQSVGTSRANEEGALFLEVFVNEAIMSGSISRLIKQHGVAGLDVASR